MTDKDEIAALRAELDALKAAVAPKPAYSGPSGAEWDAQMHEMRQRRANAVPSWLIRETVGGVTDADARDIAAARHAPQSPSIAGVPSSQTITGVHPGGGPSSVNVGGWREATPLRTPPGTYLVDALCIADDIKQRGKGKP